MSRQRRTGRALTGLAALVSCGLATPATAQPVAPTGLQPEVVFNAYSPLSSNAELARRRLSPLLTREIAAKLAHDGVVLADQPVDLTQEKFVVYAPAAAPARGYGLMVFVPPWPQAVAPKSWRPVLDQFGVIFVSAARSGNDVSGIGRREPLAILAEQNVVLRYNIDPDRIYVAGLSGGSRTAMRLALAYPDVFKGAILNAGSDPIGAPGVPAPPKDVLEAFQATTHLIYMTGSVDEAAQAADEDSRRSMRSWCVFNFEVQDVSGMGHDLAPPAALARALQALETPMRPDPAKLASCRASLENELTAGLERVAALIASGKRGDARKGLADMDTRYGGLAAPRSIDLAERLGPAE